MHHLHTDESDHADVHALTERFGERVSYDLDGNLVCNDLDRSHKPDKKPADRPDPDGLDYLDEFLDS